MDDRICRQVVYMGIVWFASALEVHRQHTEIAATGGKLVTHELAVGFVLFDAVVDPTGRVGPGVDEELGLDPQQVAPAHGSVVGSGLSGQEAVHNGFSFVGLAAAEKAVGRSSGGQSAGEVELAPAQEDGVTAKIGPQNAPLLKLRSYHLVERVRGIDRGGTTQKSKEPVSCQACNRASRMMQ